MRGWFGIGKSRPIPNRLHLGCQPPASPHTLHRPRPLPPPSTTLAPQEEAVSAISRAIRRARVGLKNPNRPIASFIFAGPTGVGKSELAKTLANYYFGSEEAMVGTGEGEGVGGGV